MATIQNALVLGVGFVAGSLFMHFRMLDGGDKGWSRGSGVPDVRAGRGNLKQSARAQSSRNLKLKQTATGFAPHKPTDLKNGTLRAAKNFFQNTKVDEKLRASTFARPMKKDMFADKGWVNVRQKYKL